MVIVTKMPSVPMTSQPMQLFAHVKRVIRISVLTKRLFVKVKSELIPFGIVDFDIRLYLVTDSCKVKNGGCDQNALCSHADDTFDIVCKCKTGYTNTGSEKAVRCEGNKRVFYEKTLTNKYDF